MNFAKLFFTLVATASAMGHFSSLAVRNLRFDLAARADHRRMVMESLQKVKKIGNPYRRAAAMEKLRKIVAGLNFLYENQPTEEQIRQEDRRNRFKKYHSE